MTCYKIYNERSIDLLAPFLVELFNRSLSLGVFPASFKIAYITLLKKSNLDSADVRSYRPMSNLSVLSKLLERLVVRQLLVHLTAFKLLEERYGSASSTIQKVRYIHCIVTQRALTTSLNNPKPLDIIHC